MTVTSLPYHAERIEHLHRERSGLQAAVRALRSDIRAGDIAEADGAERIARLNVEIAHVRADLAAAEAAVVEDGFNLYTFRDVLRLRRMTACARAEHDTLLAMYRDELGIAAERAGR
ncbi:GapR family DNA-binding domain-containing protein [Roseospira visakhapatnamensis]|uniref:Uncharacterized protein (UPF0335 family) n=1 Tax=Roseospira visakhapatnamensis TaxID=390880 RepID=A0A7W6RFN2_9PROT|nr:GapR family DNA-binding domain-containing protein [Roseospira visakhapatnamensis]MBB4267700.1 uncharacterized protein (UPF0335 family) [Roseospira visakhapatnamensis]